MKQLNGTLRLYDVADLEATCRSVLDRALRSRGVHFLAPDLYEEALAFFIGEAWIMGDKYDPERVRNEDGSIGQSFNTHLHRWLPLRLADWYRTHYVDVRYVEAPTLVGEEYAELAPDGPKGQHSWTEDAGSVEEVELRGVLVATQSFSLSVGLTPIGEAA